MKARSSLLLASAVLASTGARAATPAADPKPAEKQAPTSGSLTTPSTPATPATGGSTVTPGGAANVPSALPSGDEGKPDSVEIQVRLLADKLAASFQARPGAGRYERWAVVPFGELGEDVTKHHLGEVVAAQVEGSLKNDHGYFCVERMKLGEIVKEVALAQSGILDESKAHSLGTQAGADVLVVGSVGMLGDKYVVNARAVSVAESKVLAAASVNIQAANLVALSSDAVVLRTKSDAVFRSLIVPGWGQFYNRQEQKGGFLMFAAGALLVGGATFYGLGKSAESEYGKLSPQSPGACAGRAGDQFSACVEQQRQTATSRYQTSNALFIGLGAVWLYNILDAYMFGYSPDSARTAANDSLSVDVAPNGVLVKADF